MAVTTHMQLFKFNQIFIKKLGGENPDMRCTIHYPYYMPRNMLNIPHLPPCLNLKESYKVELSHLFMRELKYKAFK